jgi:hypothetical protein
MSNCGGTPLLAAACEKADPLGRDRFNPVHRGVALAGTAPLNRLELSGHRHSRCHKLPHDPAKVEACQWQTGVRCLPQHAEEIVVDLDALGHLGAWHAGRAALQRLLRGLLLSAALRFRRRYSACGRHCGPATRTPPTGWWPRWPRSWRRSGNAAARRGSSCAGTAVFAGRKTWPDVSGKLPWSIIVWAGRQLRPGEALETGAGRCAWRQNL